MLLRLRRRSLSLPGRFIKTETRRILREHAVIEELEEEGEGERGRKRKRRKKKTIKNNKKKKIK